MSPQRSAAVLAALCGTFVLAGWGAAGLVSLVLPGIENGGVPIAVATPQATARADKDVGVSSPATGRVVAAFADLGATPPPAAPTVQSAPASTPDPAPNDVAATAPPVVVTETGNSAALPDPAPTLPPEALPVQIVSPRTSDPAPNDVAATAPPVVVTETGNSAALPDPAPMLRPEAPPVRTAPASTPDPVPSDVAATLPTEIAEPGSRGAALPDPGPMPPEAPPAQVVSPSTPDPAPNDVAAATLPAETAEPGSGAASSDPGPMPPAAPPIQIVSPSTPDPAPTDVAATLPAEAAEPGSLGATLPDPGPMPSAAPPVEIVALRTPVPNDVAAATPGVDAAETVTIVAAWPRTLPPPAAPGVQIASLGMPDPVRDDAKELASSIEALDECFVPEICIDRYLWSLYQRTPKVDANKVVQRIKATVKRKGKTRTVTKTFTKYVVADFTWKDPIAAERVGMSLKDYVIGGMDRRFKLKLYRALRAMDDAGLMPGITSAFRDDYRQSIASGNKAASDSSYHGGSRRGGYGYGLAADLVSVKGETRMERFANSRELWSWIDAREKELGVGRPYLDRDPPHVGPIDGTEYSVKRGRARVKLAGLAKAKLAGLATSTRQAVAASDHPGTMKRAAR